jgi:hypothetical protein
MREVCRRAAALWAFSTDFTAFIELKDCQNPVCLLLVFVGEATPVFSFHAPLASPWVMANRTKKQAICQHLLLGSLLAYVAYLYMLRFCCWKK